jgi:Fic family protein
MAQNQTAWRTVDDLPSNWAELASGELETLRDVWRDQAKQLKANKALKEFNERLAREWAIETGVLEHLYTIDEGVTRLLVEQGLHAALIPYGATDKDPAYVMALIKDQHEAIEWLFAFVDTERELNSSFIKELHQLITRHQHTAVGEDQFGLRQDVALLKGAWRTQPTRISRLDDRDYICCPPEQVASAMDLLINMYAEHRKTGVPTEIEAAWLHHRFTEIHPFQDGNGRVARSLATLVFLRDGFFPLVVRRGDREEYLRVLYEADAGQLGGLVEFFSRLQKRSFVEALGISREVLHDRVGLRDIIAAARERLQERAREQERRMAEVFAYADRLWSEARDKMVAATKDVNEGLSGLNLEYRAWSDAAQNDTAKSGYFRHQIIEAAKQLKYFANTRTYRAWVRLSIKTEFQTDFLISLHCIGADFRGVMVANAFSYRRDTAGEDASTVVAGVEPLITEPFLFNYNDDLRTLQQRFRKWVDQVLTVGLDRWRRSL